MTNFLLGLFYLRRSFTRYLSTTDFVFLLQKNSEILIKIQHKND